MRRALGVSIIVLCIVVGTPLPAHAWFGLDFMEWLNDTSGPGPFHVFGVDVTLACWGQVATARKLKPLDVLQLPGSFAGAGGSEVGASAPVRSPEPTRPEIEAGLRALGLNPEKSYYYYDMDGNVALEPGKRKALRSVLTTFDLDFGCNQPAEDDDPKTGVTRLADQHGRMLLLGVVANYLFTPLNHLEYVDVSPGGDTPNIHALLLLGTADTELNQFMSAGIGAGVIRFMSHNRFSSFNKPAIQFRVGFRPFKHRDGESTKERRSALGVLTDAERIEQVRLQSLLKKLSALRFMFGLTWLPTGDSLTAENFGAKPGWKAKGDEFIMTANFSIDLSRLKKGGRERARY